MAYSEDFISLRTKAEDLIVGSSGNIQLVIGLETGNKQSYKISAWRPDFVRFGNEDAVKMKAIIEQDETTTYPHAELTKTITLCYHDLVDYFTRAQEFDVQRPPFPNLRLLKTTASTNGRTNT